MDIPFEQLKGFAKENSVIYDVKGLLPYDLVDGSL